MGILRSQNRSRQATRVLSDDQRLFSRKRDERLFVVAWAHPAGLEDRVLANPVEWSLKHLFAVRLEDDSLAGSQHRSNE
jgi:hypothetical protein